MKRLLLILAALVTLGACATAALAATTGFRAYTVSARPVPAGKAPVPAKSVPYAARIVTFSPNGDGLNDQAIMYTCAARGAKMVRASYLHWRQNTFTLASASESDAKLVGPSRMCKKGDVLWRGVWGGQSEIFTAMYRHGGAYWMTMCARNRGWVQDKQKAPKDIRMKGCAANPIIANLQNATVERDWTRSFGPGERVPMIIHTDRQTVTIQLRTGSGQPVQTWQDVDPRTFRLYAPTLEEGDNMRLVVDAGGQITNTPLPVRSRYTLDAPAPSTALVVMPSLTWLAYNRSDEDRDGWQDTWYATGLTKKGARVPITAPLISSTLEQSEADYEWSQSFFTWRAGNAQGHVGNVRTQVVTDAELGQMNAQTLRRYSVVVFPGHSEYFTGEMFDTLQAYRQLGGDIMFLSANNFYRRVTIDRDHTNGYVRGAWPASGNNRTTRYSDYAMVGLGYTALEYSTRFPLALTAEAFQIPGLMDGINAQPGESAGTYAIEFDALPPAGAPNADLAKPIWRDPTKPNQGVGAVMQHPSGATTFSAGSMLFPLMIIDPGTPEHDRALVQAMLANMYVRLGAS
jgi:hypothetical protein